MASLFEFSLMLRSASPRLVLYQQLAEESLSSFPLFDENIAPNENFESKKANPLLVGMNPKGPGGRCCWIDTGGALFSDVAELLSWVQSPNER